MHRLSKSLQRPVVELRQNGNSTTVYARQNSPAAIFPVLLRGLPVCCPVIPCFDSGWVAQVVHLQSIFKRDRAFASVFHCYFAVSREFREGLALVCDHLAVALDQKAAPHDRLRL